MTKEIFMEKEVLFNLNGNGEGLFYINEHRKQIARMDIKISGKSLIVLHTEVNPAYEGNGLANKMFLEMVRYARENKLKVNALCPYVMLQFKKAPDLYADVMI